MGSTWSKKRALPLRPNKEERYPANEFDGSAQNDETRLGIVNGRTQIGQTAVRCCETRSVCFCAPFAPLKLTVEKELYALVGPITLLVLITPPPLSSDRAAKERRNDRFKEHVAPPHCQLMSERSTPWRGNLPAVPTRA